MVTIFISTTKTGREGEGERQRESKKQKSVPKAKKKNYYKKKGALGKIESAHKWILISNLKT